MPRASQFVPRYRKHKASGQAVVDLDGKTFYLGPYGTKTSKAEYNRLVGEWMAAGRNLAAVDAGSDLNLNEVLIAYWRFAERYYQKHGQPTEEVGHIRLALRPLAELYGHTSTRGFGPLALKGLQQHFIRMDLCRNQVNQQIG